jgi:hypothetical protein
VRLLVLDINNEGSYRFLQNQPKKLSIGSETGGAFFQQEAQLNFYSPLADLLYYLNSRQDFISLCSQPSLD